MARIQIKQSGNAYARKPDIVLSDQVISKRVMVEVGQLLHAGQAGEMVVQQSRLLNRFIDVDADEVGTLEDPAYRIVGVTRGITPTPDSKTDVDIGVSMGGTSSIINTGDKTFRPGDLVQCAPPRGADEILVNVRGAPAGKQLMVTSPAKKDTPPDAILGKCLNVCPPGHQMDVIVGVKR